MDAGRQFLGERLIDEALPRHPVVAGKGGGDDRQRKMRFAFRTRAGMPGVTMRLVDNVEPARRQSQGQLLTDRIGDGHISDPSMLAGSSAAASARNSPRRSTTK